VDTWEGGPKETRFDFNFTAGAFVDLKVEYKELTGRAAVKLEWASYSAFRTPVPSAAFYYAAHTAGVAVQGRSGGAWDYPFTPAEGEGLSQAAGEPVTFVIQVDVNTHEGASALFGEGHFKIYTHPHAQCPSKVGDSCDVFSLSHSPFSLCGVP
jgi:hypothetical protein